MGQFNKGLPSREDEFDLKFETVNLDCWRSHSGWEEHMITGTEQRMSMTYRTASSHHLMGRKYWGSNMKLEYWWRIIEVKLKRDHSVFLVPTWPAKLYLPSFHPVQCVRCPQEGHYKYSTLESFKYNESFFKLMTQILVWGKIPYQ